MFCFVNTLFLLFAFLCFFWFSTLTTRDFVNCSLLLVVVVAYLLLLSLFRSLFILFFSSLFFVFLFFFPLHLFMRALISSSLLFLFLFISHLFLAIRFELCYTPHQPQLTYEPSGFAAATTPSHNNPVCLHMALSPCALCADTLT